MCYNIYALEEIMETEHLKKARKLYSDVKMTMKTYGLWTSIDVLDEMCVLFTKHAYSLRDTEYFVSMYVVKF